MPGSPATRTEGERAAARPGASRPNGMDLVLGSAIAIAAGLAAIYHPDRLVLRGVLTVPALLVVPGYLLLQAILPSIDAAPTRTQQGVLALGISPALVGLVALSTAVTPWGFHRTPIILGVMLTSLGLAGTVLYRRVFWVSSS